MNYPKIGPVRVFALDGVIHIIDADGGKPLKFTSEEAEKLAQALNGLASALDTSPKGMRKEPCTNCGQLMVTIGKWKKGEEHLCNTCAKGLG